MFVNKLAVTGISDPVLFAGAKNLIVGVILIGVLLALGKRHEVAALTKPQWTKLAAVGVIGGSLPFALFFSGLSQIPAVNGAILHKTLFIFVAILAAVFLRERLSALQWLGVAALFVANLLVGGFSGFSDSFAELLVLVATVLWAIENVIAKKVLSEVSSVVVASARMVIGGGVLAVFLLASGRLSGFGALSMESLLWILVTSGLLCGYVLMCIPRSSMHPPHTLQRFWCLQRSLLTSFPQYL